MTQHHTTRTRRTLQARTRLRLLTPLLLTLTLPFTLTLGGCMPYPVLSEPAPATGPQKTLTQLRTQALELTTLSMTGTKIPDQGWYWGAKADGPVTPWTTELMDYFPPEICGEGKSTPLQFHLTMDFNHDPYGDPRTTAKNITTAWEKAGFTVSTVSTYTTASPNIEIRGDRADGALVGYFASHEIINITTITECSSHPTLLDKYNDNPDTPPPRHLHRTLTMPTTLHSRRSVLTPLLLTLTLALGGCMPYPVLSEPAPATGPPKTLTQLRTQALGLV